MLSDFSWDMTGYIPKHAVNPHGDGIIPYAAERIFQLEPEPPAVGNLNEYILSALQEKNLIYFSFFLHHYEPQLNKRIKDFLGVDGGDLYDTDRFIDIKLSCREQMLQKLMDYDLAKGAEYATYIFPFIRDAMLRFRMGEEKWSVSSLTNYKMVRSMAWLLRLPASRQRSRPSVKHTRLHRSSSPRTQRTKRGTSKSCRSFLRLPVKTVTQQSRMRSSSSVWSSNPLRAKHE